MKLFTIGFTKTTAESFFHRLSNAGVKTLVDVRLNNVSQLAGFAKRDDLQFFARAICGIAYRHVPEMAPTKELFDSLKGQGIWKEFEASFTSLMAQRQIENFDQAGFDGACLLCAEAKPHRCHRRLVAEYLREKWSGVQTLHL